ncbi:MAG: PqqD family protein [Bacteroidota bacterium]|nr:PqqD family protein [Bacteroidota bacterium]
MKIKKNIALNDSGFIFDPSTGDSFNTNPVGLEIVQMLKQGKSQKEIGAFFLKEYSVDEATFEKDFYDFVNMLSKLKLTERDENEKI